MGKSDKNLIRPLLMTGGSYWPKINASELHFARSFQGHPTWPYLAHSNTRPNTPNTVFGCAKYGRVGYPWKDLAKCSSVALILGQDRQTLVITVITLIWSWRVWIAMFVLLDRLTGFEDLNATPHLWTLHSTNMMLSVFSLPIILRGGLICLFIKVQSFEILSFRST